MARQRHEHRRQAIHHSEARSERRARHKTRKRFRRALYLGISGVIGVLVIVSLFLPQLGGTPSQSGDATTAQAALIIPEGTDYVGYTSQPPTYGPRWPTGAEWGVYTTEELEPEEVIPEQRQLANLAEGGVLIQYNSEDQELIGQLTQFAEGQPNFPCHLIVAPYPSMEPTISVTAWGTMATMEEYDEEQLQQFVDSFRGNGPQTAPCTP